jgi:hypothetical protein
VSERRLRALQRASAIYDLVAVTPFALPGVAAWEIARLHETALHLGISGDFPAFSPTHLFFANVFGIFAITWSVLRLRNPEPQYAFYDVVLRFAFASTMLLYVVAYDVTRILLLFVAFELVWGGLQLFGYVNRRAVPAVLAEAGGYDAK